MKVRLYLERDGKTSVGEYPVPYQRSYRLMASITPSGGYEPSSLREESGSRRRYSYD